MNDVLRAQLGDELILRMDTSGDGTVTPEEWYVPQRSEYYRTVCGYSGRLDCRASSWELWQLITVGM